MNLLRKRMARYDLPQQIKAKGEVIEEYMVVQATKVFTNEKDPEDVFTVTGFPGTEVM